MGSRPVFRAHFALMLVSLVVQPSIAAPSGKELLDALTRGDSVAVIRLPVLPFFSGRC
jgi:hypothetical protein